MYGFSEGPWFGRKLRKQLDSRGYTTTRDVRGADIIIAHSAACYLVPQNARAKLVLHLGYTYWPGRTLFDSLKMTLRYDYHSYPFATWLTNSVVHGAYTLNLAQTIRMIPGWRDPLRALDKLAPARHIFVRNQHDTYCEPTALVQATNTAHTYVSMPGGHNHLWDNPEAYVNLLQSLYE